jgi:hypothetical protein
MENPFFVVSYHKKANYDDDDYLSKQSTKFKIMPSNNFDFYLIVLVWIRYQFTEC